MEHTIKTDFFEDLWRVTIGTDFVPPRHTFSRWAACYETELFSRALEITKRKIGNMRRFGAAFTNDQIARYCSGTCAHMRQDEIEANGAAVPDGK